MLSNLSTIVFLDPQNHPVFFPRSFFIRPRRLNPWTVKSCRSNLGHRNAQLVVYRFKLGLKRQCWNRPKQITLAFFHSALRATTLTLTASQAHYFQTPSLFSFLAFVPFSPTGSNPAPLPGFLAHGPGVSPWELRALLGGRGEFKKKIALRASVRRIRGSLN